jgi:HK97 family phage portal protein
VETQEQREERIRRLDEGRASRGGSATLVAETEGPVEIAPGRGDLTRSSVPVGPSSPLLPAPWLPAVAADGIRSVDGRQISYAKLFAEQAWVAAAVMRQLTWAVRVPLKVYRRTGDDSRERLRPDEHPLATAVARPWEGGFPAQLTMALLGPFLVHGNSVTRVQEGRSGAIQFTPFDWRTTSPVKPSPNSRTITGWQPHDPDTGEKEQTFSSDEAVHAAWWSPLGPDGVSPLRQLNVTLRLEDAATRYQQNQFRNGARPPSAVTATTEFLSLDQDVRDALLKQLRDDITLLYAGPENGGRPALLPPGLDWKPIGHTSREAELVEQRYIDREEIAAVYMIPPPMLGDLRRATFSNIVELRQIAYTDGLGPPLVIIEQALTSTYQQLTRERDVYVEFDFAGVLRGDFLKEINALRAAISSGLLMPNEGRAVLNRPQVDDERANQLWMPWNNLQPMGEGPPQNRAARRAGAQEEASASRLIVAESWRSYVERERAEYDVKVAPGLVDEPEQESTTAEEAIA